MRRYVVGFMFDKKLERVLMIRKTHPRFQAGKLNGIGGKIEPGESPLAAMVREFHEEAGVVHDRWQPFAKFSGVDDVGAGPSPYEVTAFAAKGNLYAAKTTTEEQVEICTPHFLLFAKSSMVTENVPWLMCLAVRSFDRPDFYNVEITAAPA